MSIIYSYPTSQPTVDDLLIGTDVNDENATKSFTVQSLVSLINAAAGSGTVTFVQIATDAFLTATGGPIRDTGTITVGFSATGTPSATTFLRGDNQWVIPTVSAGISVLNQGVSLTSDVSQFNFTGEGVTATNVGNSISVNVAAQAQTITGLTQGAGISLSSSTGNVTISNTGVTQIVGGTGILISPVTGAGTVTLSVENQTSGTVTSVSAGSGLELISGSTILNPTIGIDYSGDITYITIPSAGNPTSTDNFAFQKGASGVRKGTFSTLPMDSLTAVKTYTDTGDAKAVQHDTDTYSSVATAKKIITLTTTEYTNLATKDGNTLYLTTSTAAAQFTKTLAIQNNVSGFANGSLTGDGIGTQVTGAENSNWSFTTGVSANTGYSYSGNAPVTISGTFDSDSTVTSTLTGSITANSVPQCTSTLTTASAVTPILQASYFTLTSGSSSTAACTSSLNASTVFPVVYALTTAGTNAGYTYTAAATTYTGNNGTYGNSTTITGTANGTVSLNNYTYTVVVDSSAVTTSGGATYSLSTTGPVTSVNGSRTAGANTSLQGSIAAGTNYTQTTNASPGTNSDISGLNSTSIVTGPFTANGNVTITHTFTGTVQSNQATMTLVPTGSFTPAAAYPNPGEWGYTLDGGSRQVPSQSSPIIASGTIGQTVIWTFLPNPPNISSSYTQTGQTISTNVPAGTTQGVLGTDATVNVNTGATAILNRFSLNIASTGGQNNPLQPNYACNQGSVASVIWTTADRSSTGLQVGDIAYVSQSGSTPYSTNTLTWWKTIAAGGAYNFQIVNFNSSGAVNAVQGC